MPQFKRIDKYNGGRKVAVSYVADAALWLILAGDNE